jgi:ATP-dependent DNA helicase RecQ
MAEYARGTQCRWRTILEYFAESAPFERCGTCDACVHPEPAVEAPPLHIKPQAATLEVGDRVEVPRYGKGVVEAVGDDRVAVKFPRAGTREFLARFVRRVLGRA